MDKSDIIPGDVYMGRDRATPYLLVTNRLYAERHEGKRVFVEVAPADVKAARGASEAERAQKTWTNFGYFAVKPSYIRNDRDYYAEMQAINIQSLIGPDRLPAPENLPAGYELVLVTSLQTFRGDYAELRAKQISESERAALAAKVAQDRYNELVDAANEVLGADYALERLDGPWKLVPETIELTLGQLQVILGVEA